MRLRRATEGFVLVATLWLVAALALLAAYVDDVASANVQAAEADRRSLQRELDMRSTEATLIYLLTTNRANHRAFVLDREQTFAELYPEELPTTGDGELLITDVRYRGIGETTFSVQDEAGLVSINAPQSPQFAALLRHAGLDNRQASRLVAVLKDYTDSNAGLSLNGAERLDYERAGLAPPADWIMLTPLEAQRALDFDTLMTPAQWRMLKPLLTIRPQAGYNFNTMPPSVVAAMLRSDEESVAGLLAARYGDSVDTLQEIRSLTGRSPALDEEALLTLPGRTFRLAIHHPDHGFRRLAGLRLSPYGEYAPWHKDYEYLEQVDAAARGAARKAETALF